MIERVVVGAGMDEADNWIAERAGRGDIVITADVPLASRCVKAGAAVIAPNGKPFTANSIGMTLATRNLMDSLRSAGEITGGPKPFSARDRSQFPCGAGSGDRPAQAGWIWLGEGVRHCSAASALIPVHPLVPAKAGTQDSPHHQHGPSGFPLGAGMSEKASALTVPAAFHSSFRLRHSLSYCLHGVTLLI